MKIEYTIRGITLRASELTEISRYYAAACTAEFVMENFPEITDERKALQIGHAVRELMDKYNCTEGDAIRHAKSKQPALFHS